MTPGRCPSRVGSRLQERAGTENQTEAVTHEPSLVFRGRERNGKERVNRGQHRGRPVELRSMPKSRPESKPIAAGRRC